jgi:hypothetical protein
MRFAKNILSATMFAVVIATTGCASIVGESQYPVAVKSTPAGANFEVRNKSGELVHTGQTPSSVTLKSSAGFFKGESYKIKFMKPGHADTVVNLESGVSGWYWGNILIGGLIGMLIVDPATGAMYNLPDQVSGALNQQAAGKPVELTIGSIEQLSADQVSKLVRLN